MILVSWSAVACGASARVDAGSEAAGHSGSPAPNTTGTPMGMNGPPDTADSSAPGSADSGTSTMMSTTSAEASTRADGSTRTDGSAGARDSAADGSTEVGTQPGGMVSIGPTTLYALGTGLNYYPTTAPPWTGPTENGPDGCLEQSLTSSGFAPIAQPPGNPFFAGGTWEPISQQFFLFGDYDGASLTESYSPSTNTWTLFSSPWSGGQGFVGAYNGLLYVLGGFDISGYAIATAYSFDPASKSYKTLKSLPAAAGDLFGATVGATMYLGGGCNNNNGPGQASPCLDTWYSYDPSSDTLKPLANVPTARGEAAAAELNGTIYVIGGFTGPAGETVGTNTVYAYDVSGGAWTQKKSYPISVSGACAAVWKGTLYVLGGYTTGYVQAVDPSYTTSKTKKVYAYDPNGDAWTEQPSMALDFLYGSAVSVCGAAQPHP